jgi:hypothetical protein
MESSLMSFILSPHGEAIRFAGAARRLMVLSIGEKDGTLLYAAQVATSHLKNASKMNRKSKPESQKTKALSQSSGEKQDPPHACEPI